MERRKGRKEGRKGEKKGEERKGINRYTFLDYNLERC